MPAGDLNLWAASWLAQMIAKVRQVAAKAGGYKYKLKPKEGLAGRALGN